MDYYEITKAIRMKLEYVHAAAGEKDADNITFNVPDIYKSNFEDIICNYVDAINEIKRLKNVRKRLIIFYKAIGYMDWQVSEFLHIGERKIRYHISWLKRFFSEEGPKNDEKSV
jgi:hypothetical protein